MPDPTTTVPAIIRDIQAAESVVADVLPAALTLMSWFAPSAAGAIAPWVPLVSVIVNATNAVAADTGKPLEQVIQDVINHLTPGQPGAPALT